MSEESKKATGSMALPNSIPLTYDNYVPVRDRRSRKLFPVFWLGSMIVPVLLGVFLIFYLRRSEPLFSAVIEGLVATVFGGVMGLLLATLVLGLTIWIRIKLLREVRFAGFRTAFISGIAFGLFPVLPLSILPLAENQQNLFLFVELGWHIVFPIAAGFWLYLSQFDSGLMTARHLNLCIHKGHPMLSIRTLTTRALLLSLAVAGIARADDAPPSTSPSLPSATAPAPAPLPFIRLSAASVNAVKQLVTDYDLPASFDLNP